MLSGRLLSFVALISLGAGVGCAGVSQKPGGVDGSATGAGGTGLGGGNDARPGIDGITVITTMCGNGSVDNGEQCDDGNKTPGDGCSVICQIPAGWSCTGSPSVCTMAGVCGDGILGATEACDDGNRTAGDGCAANCDGVDSGYECRVPGRLCIPACGDGRKLGGEGCDDGNTMDGDGCSVVCQVEPGAVCTESRCGGRAPAPQRSAATASRRATRAATAGRTTRCTRPAARARTGCSSVTPAVARRRARRNRPAAAPRAPRRRAPSPAATATSKATEACDDGNSAAGDGCSPTCTLEAGFMCTNKAAPGRRDVHRSGDGYDVECLKLPVIYRDFKIEKETGGHPDFFYLGAPVCDPSVTGASDQPRGWILVRQAPLRFQLGRAREAERFDGAVLGSRAGEPRADGKPVFNMARTATPTLCDCQFTDWSHNGNGAARARTTATRR